MFVRASVYATIASGIFNPCRANDRFKNSRIGREFVESEEGKKIKQ